jgi:hypothetical protein
MIGIGSNLYRALEKNEDAFTNILFFGQRSKAIT